MLSAITEDGTAHWTCPHCRQANAAHVSHEQLQWMSAEELSAMGGHPLIRLPRCACGTQVSLRTHYPDEELQEPVITRDETGKITAVEIRGAANLTVIRDHAEKRVAPDPRAEQLRAAGVAPALIAVLAPDIVTFERVIDSVEPHPALALHRALIGHLATIGKHPPGEG